MLRSDKFIVKRHKRSLREMKGSSAAIGEEGMCYARSLETYKNELCSNYVDLCYISSNGRSSAILTPNVRDIFRDDTFLRK